MRGGGLQKRRLIGYESQVGYKRVARSQARASCARPSRVAAPRSRRAASSLGTRAEPSPAAITRRGEGRKVRRLCTLLRAGTRRAAAAAPGSPAAGRRGRGRRARGHHLVPRPSPRASVRGAPSGGPRPGHQVARDGFLGRKGEGEGGVLKTRPSASPQIPLGW